MGIHIRHLQSDDPQRVERKLTDARRAMEKSDGDVAAAARRFVQAMANSGDCEELRKVAKIINEGLEEAAEGQESLREAREAAAAGNSETAEAAAKAAQDHATGAHNCADRAIFLL